MTQVQISAARRQDGTTVAILHAPYHPDCPAAAKNLGGVWDGTDWQFDIRDLDRVRDLARTIYGDDGMPTERVTVRVVASAFLAADESTGPVWQRKGLIIAGRTVASVRGRDSGARQGEGIVVEAGRFDSGGSRANPQIVWSDSTVVLIRDLPEAKARELIDAGHAELVDEPQVTSSPAPTQSAVEALWAQIAALSEADQVEIRNRLLQAL
jgi:hypothetical protein